MKVGISFVSVANARANLAAENDGWNVDAVARARRRDQWNALLGRIAVDRRHARASSRPSTRRCITRCCIPTCSATTTAQYPGFDGKVHTARGYTQYANFSGWDIYRSEVPLLALLAPRETGDMMHSLLADFEQSGFLPKWAFADYDSAEINGDSADPILADAYAFGVRNFDAREALAGDGARARTRSGTGARLGRRAPGQRPVPRARMDPGRPPRQDLVRLHDRRLRDARVRDRRQRDRAAGRGARRSRRPRRRSRSAPATGAHLFNPATGYLAARRADGTFPPGPAFQRSPLPGHRPGRLGGRQRDPIHVERSAGPARPLRRDGREPQAWSPSSTASSRTSTRAASSPTTGPGTSPRSASRGSTTSRARRGARRTSCAASSTDLYSPTPERRTRERRPRRAVVVVRVGRHRDVPGDPGLGRPRARQPAVPARERSRSPTAGASRSTRPAASAANRYVQSLRVSGIARARGVRIATTTSARGCRRRSSRRARTCSSRCRHEPNPSWGAAAGPRRRRRSPKSPIERLNRAVVRSAYALHAVAVRARVCTASRCCAPARPQPTSGSPSTPPRWPGPARRTRPRARGRRRRRARRVVRLRPVGAGVRRAGQSVDRARRARRARDPRRMAGRVAAFSTPRAAPAATRRTSPSSGTR